VAEGRDGLIGSDIVEKFGVSVDNSPFLVEKLWINLGFRWITPLFW